MKILIVNKFLHPNGGSETYIFKLGDALKEHGHEVEYFGMEHEGRCVGNRVNSYTSDMDFHGGSKFAKLTYPVKTIYSVEARKKIRLVLDDFQPDVVHLNNFNFQLTPSIILEIRAWDKATFRKTKIVMTAHDCQLVCPNHVMNNPNTGENCEKCLGGKYLNCIKGKCIHSSTAKSVIGAMEAFYWARRKTYEEIDAVICPSFFLKNKLDTNKLLNGRTIGLHNFVEKTDGKTVTKEDYVIYFGRYSEEKGVKTLVEVCKQLPDIRFVFAGRGPLEEIVNNIPNIENVGFKSGEELKLLISRARFSLCPSECYENCPFSVMESQIYGTPVIGADIGGIPELINEGKTGELFESGNSAELKEKIERLWKDRKKTDEYSKNCENVHFDTLDEYYIKIMEIYAFEKNTDNSELM
ncbi:MAG: glycosyltransferase [Lachnospiraceae bacterium]|nr:glycosyltransferase [Lachnospiraceae bacterium]